MDDILRKNEQINQDSVEGVNNDRTVVEKATDSSQIPPEDLDSRWLRWKCLVCGYLYEGVTRINICPKCGNEDPDKFEDAE